jgi:glycosyltransferase involved in cell wall biosynthesis
MPSSGSSPKLRVLLVPDHIEWVTGTICRRIAHHNRWIEPTICSDLVLRQLIASRGGFPGEVDLVHFQVPNWNLDLIGHFEGKTPCVATIHHVETDLCVASAPRCDALTTASSQWLDFLDEAGVDPSKRVFMPYGVDTDQFRPATPGERRKTRARLGLSEDALVIGFAAKRTSDTSGRKGLDTLEKAIAETSRRVPGVAFVIIGPGWAELVERQREAGIRCVHIPFVRDLAGVAAVQRALDVYWITSRIEGGPVPLLEAMASGVCCVATPVGMVRDVVRDGENGLMAPLDGVEAFVGHTKRLASDRDLRRGMGEAARRTIVDGYQWWQVCRQAHELYGTAIERFRERPGVVRAPSMPPPDPSPRRDAPSRIPREAFDTEVRSWVIAREHLSFASVLENMGERRAAHVERLRSIIARPSDREVVRYALQGLPFAGTRRSMAAAARLALGRPFRRDPLTTQSNGK